MALARVNFAVGSSGSSAAMPTSAFVATAGNLIIACVGWEDTTNTLDTVTDTAANSYTLGTLQTTAGSTGARCRLAYAMNITGHATNVVTANFSAAVSFVRIAAVQYSGVALTGALDVQVGNVETTSSADAIAGDLVTTNADDVLVVAAKWYTGETMLPFTNWTEVTEVGSEFAVDERIVSATGTYNAAIDGSVATLWAAAAMALKGVTGATAVLTGTMITGGVTEAEIVSG